MLNLSPLEAEYREIIEEVAHGKRPMTGLVRLWSQTQREVQDMKEAGGFDEEEAERMLDRLFSVIDAHLSRLIGKGAA